MDGSQTARMVVLGPEPSLSARRRGLNRLQLSILGLALLGFMLLGARDLGLPGLVARWLFAGGFFVVVCSRLAATLLTLKPRLAPRPIAGRNLPHYTVVVALKDEAAVANQLVARLSALDYPPDRLTGYLIVEPGDHETRKALIEAPRPRWLQVLTAPPGSPTTKPRALNVGLSLARPGLLTVYDAEDEPDPGQLREAAARFHRAEPDLACLQAPLRIRTPGRHMRWMERQFALEYASLFEVTLPALARLRMPLPLGGTSNHFRVDVLREIGGWDPWNVTEDADLGFRLHRLGYRSGVLRLPTWETPPPNLSVWLPQRVRWLKGFMQTWGVHTREPLRLGLGGLAGLHLTLGAAVASAALQGLFLSWIAASILAAGLQGVTPNLPTPDLSLAVLGWAVATLGMLIGAARANVQTGPWDMVSAPAYWALLSVAQAHAIWRLISQPFYWDKTPHCPDQPASATPLP